MRKYLVVAMAAAMPCHAWSQTAPSLSLGLVWTPGQFEAEFASKQDYMSSVPPNEVYVGPVSASGAPTYRLLTVADIPKAADGSQSAPGITFQNEATTGMYRDATSGGLRFTVVGQDRWAMDDLSPVNATANPGLAPTFFGSANWHNPHSIHTSAHIEVTGYTRGWENGTCLLGVNANSPPVSTGCGQGGYYDMSARSVYPGQDTEAVSFFINGITPVISNAAVSSMGSTTVQNLGGAGQTIGTVVLSTALTSGQISAINSSPGPMRVQINNGYFGYTIPPGLTAGGVAVNPASADGTTIYVDNWTRAISVADLTAAGTCGTTPPAGHIAACPTFPYVGGSGAVLGTNVIPNTVGQTNGSSALSSYTVSVDVNFLTDSIYGGFHISNSDQVNMARMIEFVGVQNKTGSTTWNDNEILNDEIGGKPMATHTILAGCQNDDGAGLGICGAFALVQQGIKRGLVCENAIVSAAEGNTECVLDVSSGIGYHSTKTSGYVLMVDPGSGVASGTPPVAVIDYSGTASFAYLGVNGNTTLGNSSGTSVTVPGTMTVSGSLLLTGFFGTSHPLGFPAYTVATLPACGAGATAYASNARNAGEPAGVGTGALVTCNYNGSWYAYGYPVTY